MNNSKGKPKSYDLHFHDDAAQNTVAAEVLAAVNEGKSGLHLVAGGSGTGKSYVVDQKIRKKLGKSFSRVVSPGQLEEGEFDPESLPPKLAELIEEMADDGFNSLDVKHHVYKHKTSKPPLFVVIADGETAPERVPAQEVLAHIAQAVRECEGDGYKVVWVADAPIMHQAASIFTPNSIAPMHLKRFELATTRLEKEFPDEVEVHRLSYSPQQMREFLWENITQHGEHFLAFLEKSGHWDRTKEWKEVCDAALAGERTLFDRAFDVVAKRAQQHRSVA